MTLRTARDPRTSKHGKINVTHCRMGYSACSSERFGLKGSAVCNAVQNARNCTSNDTMLQHRRHYCSATLLRKPPISHYDHDSKVQEQPVFAVHGTHFTSAWPIFLKFVTLHTHQHIVIKVAFSLRLSVFISISSSLHAKCTAHFLLPDIISIITKPT